MVIIRPTLRLAKRIKIKLQTNESGPSSTVLGDWYANNIVLDHAQLILCTSEHARLSVVLQAAPFVTFPKRLPKALGEVLTKIGIPKDHIDQELAKMKDVVFAKSNNRSLTATLNQWRYLLQGEVEMGRFNRNDLLSSGLYLAEIPTETLSWALPCEVARLRFGLKDVRKPNF